MKRIPSRRAAVLAALLSCLLLPAVFLAQGTGAKALVVCPPTDAAGCDRIATQLALATNGGSPVFPGGVDKKYTELRTMSLSQLQSYSAVFVPSLANAPYDLLRESAVRNRLSQVLRGRVAVLSGTPDRGVTTGSSAGKLALIQNLGRWAAAQHAADGSTGLVVLQDFSDALPDGSSPRYDWIQGIAGVAVAPVTTVRTYAQVEKNGANPAAAAIMGSLAYDNMASFGLTSPASPGLVGAWGQTVNGKKTSRGDVVLVTFARTPSASYPMTQAGGTINAQGGKVVLVFPANAVSEPVSIVVDRATVSGTNYVPETAYSFAPSMTFAAPVSLTISYLESNIPGGIANEPKLLMCVYKSSAWTPVAGSTVNAAANTVTAPIDHFSRYAIFVEGGACGGEGGGGGGGGKPVGSVVVAPATASVAAGQSQTLTATVQDKNGAALSGRTVTWSSTNGGSFSTTSSTTSASGQATTQFTVGTVAGTQHVVTAAVDNKSGTSTLTVVAGSAAKLGFKVQPSNTGAGAAVTPAVQVAIQDALGNTVTGSTDNVTLAIGTNPSGGALSGTTTVAAVGGVATFSGLSIDKVGAGYTLAASSGALTGATSTAFDVTAGSASKLVFTVQPSNTAAGASITPAVQVTIQDGLGNTVTGATNSITLAIGTNPSGGALSGTATVAAVGGVATFPGLSIDKVGVGYTLAASGSGLTGATSDAFNIAPGAASTTTSTITASPTSIPANGTATSTLTVQLRDGLGNNLSASGGVVVLSTTGGSISSTTDNANGTYTATLTAPTSNGAATISGTLNGSALTSTATVDFTAGPPAKYIVTASAYSVDAGGSVTITAQLADAADTPVLEAGRTVNWSSTGGGSFSAPSSATSASGVATVTFTVSTSSGASHTVTANDGTVSGTSSAITTRAGPASVATSTIAASPTSLTANGTSTSTITVQLKDQHGNNLSASGGAVTLATTGGSLSAVTDNGNGTYTATLTAPSTVGSATISGTLGGSPLTGTASVTFVAGPPASVVVTAGASEVTAGGTVAITGLVRDAGGNPVSGVSVAWTSTNGGSFSPASSTATDATGTATVTFTTSTTTGTVHTVTGTVNGTITGTSGTITTQGPPVANDDTDAAVTGGTSAPGSSSYHIAFGASSTGVINVLTNDDLGYPVATTRTFGNVQLNGGAATGGTVAANAFGSSVSLGSSGSLEVTAAGLINLTPPTGFTGVITFDYRLSNGIGVGFDDAKVTIAVGRRPVATNDTYPATLIGNVPINTATSTNFNVTANDVADGATVNFGAATNGTAVLAPGGTFSFAPNAGFEGTASFTYTVTNGFGTSAAATVSLPVANPVWFVDAAAGAGGDGRFGTAYSCLTGAGCFSANSLDEANDRIFLFSGAYTGGLTLLNGQQLVGQGATGSSFGSVLGVTWPADSGTEPSINGTAPTITTSAASTSGLNLGSGNTLRGLTLGNATGSALSGSSFGTLTFTNVGINTTGQALSLTTGTLAGSFTQLRSTGGTNNVFLSGVATTGTTTLGAAGDVLSGATGDAFVVAGGTGSFTYPGNVTQTSSAALLNVNGGHTGTLTFQTGTLSATNGTGLQFNNADGSYAFTGTTTLSGGDAGIDVTNGSGGTFSFPGTASITNPANETVTIASSAPIFTYPGSLTKTNNSVSGITLSSNTGGTIAFSGATKVFSTGSANAVNLLNNTGATISFADSLRITTTTGVGFNATGGGTVTVAGTHNSITSAGGVALNVANTTIGAGNLVFRSISASGGSNGIVLANTGSTGRLQVTGTGAAGTGGTIQNTTGHGISLTSTSNPSFDRMNLQSNGGSGVFGTGVVGFTLTNSAIANSGTGGAANASNIDFFADTAPGTENNLSGTVTITGNTLSAPAYHNVDIQNWSGTIAELTLSNNVLTNSSTLGGGIRVGAVGSAGNVAKITRASIVGNQITGSMQAPGLQVQCGNASAGGPLGECGTEGSATNVVAITGNQVRGTSAAARIGTEGLLALLNGRGQANFNVSSNDVRHTTGRAMAVTVFGQGRMTSTVSNNTIVANNTFGAAGLEIGADSTANMASFASYRATVTGNNVSQTDGVGIYAIARGSSDSLRVKLQNNTIAAPLGGVRPGLRVDSGSTNSNTWVCANISGNASAGSGGHQGIGLRKQGTNPADDAFAVHGMAATGSPGVEAYVSGLNPAGGGVLLISATSGFTNCSFP